MQCILKNANVQLSLLLLLLLLPVLVCDIPRNTQENLYLPGDIIVGGVLSVIPTSNVMNNFTEYPDATRYMIR